MKDTVSLQVAQFAPNAWGLYDMHGNVEEWCLDPWDALADFRVTRGGSHNTEVRYLRSDVRSAAIPTDRSVLRGFRVVEEIVPEMPQEPFFAEPQPYIIPPIDTQTPFYSHNHQPAVTYTTNGDLLAIWFSTESEAGREMVVLQSRYHDGKWSPATLFYKVPERNMTGSALLTLPNGTMLHFNGVGDAGEWRDLALCTRQSLDGGLSWSRSFLAEPTHDGGAWTGTFTLDADHAEPAGYLACTQTPDGIIHLLSSRVHYRFNLQWVEQ